MFADGTCIFSTVFDININISKWALQWKMSFDPDPDKQATEVTFSLKGTQENHLVLVFNNSPVMSVFSKTP